MLLDTDECCTQPTALWDAGADAEAVERARRLSSTSQEQRSAAQARGRAAGARATRWHVQRELSL